MPNGEMLYRYRADAIYDGMTAINTAHNMIDQALDFLEGQVEGQLYLWEGDDQNAYWEHKKGWEMSINNMKTIMTTQAVPALDRILANYQSTERVNRLTWEVG